MFKKKEKTLTDEDIKNWDSLKKTLDYKSYNKIFRNTGFTKKEQFSYNKYSIENNILRKNKNLRESIKDKKVLNNNQLDDLRIDKKKLILLKKGKIRPEKTLDLHGLTTTEAKIKSIEFTKFNFSLGLRVLLIITGKGKISNFNTEKSKKGLIRKSLKSWLYDSDLRPNILGIVSSHISHGGEGAFYIYLKKNKSL